jgi:hypothetical protein
MMDDEVDEGCHPYREVNRVQGVYGSRTRKARVEY